MAAPLAPRQERLIDSLASSLSDNLIHAFPDKIGAEECLEQWRHELFVEVGCRAVADPQLLVDEAIRRAVDRWKSHSKVSKAAVLSSLGGSLLKSFLAGGGGELASIVTIDRIQATTSDEERLKLLQKVEHVDDVALDWAEVNQLLQQGLQGDHAGAYADLHATWFQQTRSSPEYQGMQLDLCRNIVNVLDVTDKEALRNHCVQLWHQMWMDWMTRGLYVRDEQVHELGRRLWTKSMAPSSPLTTFIMSVDPHARWLAAWVAHLESLQVQKLCESLEPSALAQLLAAATNTSSSANWYSLAVLASLLVSLRVSLFPWHLLGHKKQAVYMEALFDVYLQHLQTLSFGDAAIEVCIMALETILCGSPKDSAVFERLQGKLSILNEGMSSILTGI